MLGKEQDCHHVIAGKIIFVAVSAATFPGTPVEGRKLKFVFAELDTSTTFAFIAAGLCNGFSVSVANRKQ